MDNKVIHTEGRQIVEAHHKGTDACRAWISVGTFYEASSGAIIYQERLIREITTSTHDGWRGTYVGFINDFNAKCDDYDRCNPHLPNMTKPLKMQLLQNAV